MQWLYYKRTLGKKAVTLRSVWTRLHSGMAHSIAKVALESGGSMSVLHIFCIFFKFDFMKAVPFYKKTKNKKTNGEKQLS